MAKLVADVYGEALFDLAAQSNSIDSLAEQIKTAEAVLAENPEFLGLLTHPKISMEEKKSVVETVFGGRFDDAVTGLLIVIVEKGRCAEIPAVFANFLDKVREYRRIGVARVTSATELSDVQKKRIEEKLLSQTAYESFEMQYTVDASLIGGMIIRIGDRVVDASIQSKLRKMAVSLSNLQLS
ncbi:MAG: ATP synthase F1 subunit delta [Lachnospiraceae bacterium]|nr:ATP synthase F1 subunit delta [Lachnospiraceae bacterium]